MDITGQMQVKLVHGNDLAVPTTGGTTLDTKGRSLTRLSHIGKADPVEVGTKGLSKTKGSRRLALTERGGCNTTDKNVTTITTVSQAIKNVEAELGLCVAVRLQLVGSNSNLVG